MEGRSLFLSLALLVVAFSLNGANTCCCPEDWLPMNGFCYKIFDDPKNWNDSQMFCRKHKPGCHLASMHSMAESADLAEYVSDYLSRRDDAWIGLSDPRKQRIWEWSDRSCLDYQAWYPGEPNNVGDNEYCVHLVAQSEHLYWFDAPCEALHPFICQCKL